MEKSKYTQTTKSSPIIIIMEYGQEETLTDEDRLIVKKIVDRIKTRQTKTIALHPNYIPTRLIRITK